MCAHARSRGSRSAHSPCPRSEVKDVCARAVPPPKRLELGCTTVVGIVSSLVELSKLCFTLSLALLPVDVRSLDGPSAGSGVLHPPARGMTSPVPLNSHCSVPLLLGCSLGRCARSVKRLFCFGRSESGARGAEAGGERTTVLIEHVRLVATRVCVHRAQSITKERLSCTRFRARLCVQKHSRVT